MHCSMILGCAAAVLTIVLGSPTPAHSEDWKVTGEFEHFGVGKAYQIEKGHIYWVGEFSGTFVNDKKGGLFDHAGVKCPGANDIDANNKKQRAVGYCTISDASGDQAYLSWQCEGDAAGGPCRGTFDYTGGTGKFQAVNGKNTFEAHLSSNWPDGTFSAYATWNR